MEALNFRGNNYPLRVEKNLSNEENFTALDKDKLKQDTVEITSKATDSVKDTVQENWFYRQLRNIGVENPKKLMKSIGLAVLTTVGFAVLGNKMSNKTATWGQKLGDDIIGKSEPYKLLQEAGSSLKKGLKSAINSNKYTKEIHTTLTQRMEHAKLDIARGYGQGFLGIFSLTPVEIMKKAFAKKNITEVKGAVDLLTKTFNMDSKTATELAEQLFGTAKNKLTNKEICVKMSKAIKNGLGCKSNKEFLAKLQDMQANPNFKDFFNIEMKDKGLTAIFGSWWPANIINKITKGKFQRHLTGNLGDSLIKFNVVNGTMADTKAGTFIQRLITIPTESISNFVNDKSGVGAFISASCMIPLYNNVQDAPREKKLPTVLNDYVSSMGSFAFSLPVASGLTYGLASLSNLNTKNKVLLTPLKWIGDFFAVGLKDVKPNASALSKAGGKLGGVFGAILRFYLIMMVFSPKVSKIISNAVSKVFGKPYDPVEIKKEQELEKQKNTVIPELGITQGELQQKIEKNPQAIMDMQNNPKLVEAIDKNPKLLLDVLDNKPINLDEVKAENKPKTNTQSPMLQNMVNSQTNLFSSKNKSKTEQKEEENIVLKDSASYIPSSEFIAKNQPLSDLTAQQYQRIMDNSDKVLKEAEKYI